MTSLSQPTTPQIRKGVIRREAVFLGACLAMMASGTVALADQCLPHGLSSGFIENRGQLNASVRYFARGPNATIYLTDTAVILDLQEDPPVDTKGHHLNEALAGHNSWRAGRQAARREPADERPHRGCAVRLRFVDANPSPTLLANHRQSAYFNFLIGRDASKWRMRVPAFSEITYQDLWPGISLVYRVDGGRISYELIAAPGADVSRVRIEYEGADRVSQAPDGFFLVATPVGDIVDVRPVPGVSAGTLTRTGKRESGGNVTAAAGALANGQPAEKAGSGLLWSTYLPGNNNDYNEDLVLDSSGRPIVTGETYSTVFPISVGAYDVSQNGFFDAFVAKLNATGTTLAWGTYLGGSADDYGRCITRDSADDVYVSGETLSSDFPTTAGCDTSLGGPVDVYVAMLNSTGTALLWGTYLGGSGGESIASNCLAYDAGGNTVVVASSTGSSDLVPLAGAYQSTNNGNGDLYVARFSNAGVILASTYLGGSMNDAGWGLALDSSGNPVVTGCTDSSDFPTTAGVYDQTFNGSGGNFDGFVVKLNSAETALIWSTYLGGTGWDQPEAIAMDASDQPFIAGYTSSADFPASSYDRTLDGANDGFISQFSSNGVFLYKCTYLGGSGSEGIADVEIKPNGDIVVTGVTDSGDFPTTPGAYSQAQGSGDAFISEFDCNWGGFLLLSSTYLGGSMYDAGKAIAVDVNGDILVSGDTPSTDFPTTPGAYATSPNWGSEVFITKLSLDMPAAPWQDVTNPALGAPYNSRAVIWGDYDNDGDLDLYLVNDGQPNNLFRNDGNYNFVDVSSGSGVGDAGWGKSAAWADYDNDGDLDLYLANYGQSNKLFRNNGDGTFTDVSVAPLNDSGNGMGMAWADYDNDGDLDLFLANWGQPNKLFRNNGDGTFTDVSAAPLNDPGTGISEAWGDYDNDGDLDLYLVNDGQPNKLFRNNGNGTFTDVTTAPLNDTGLGRGVTWGDFDNDGYLDLYLANDFQANRMFAQDPISGSFADVATPPLNDNGRGMGVACGDYDNDGDLDIYLAKYGQANQLLENVFPWRFVDVTTGPLGDTGNGLGVALGDANNDGDLDLYLSNGSYQANKLIRNDLVAGKSMRQTSGNWLHVDLVSATTGVGGIGARVQVIAGGMSQIREISGGSGYCSQNALTATFGLGTASLVDTLRIHWPRGQVQVLTGVTPGQSLTVQEPPPTEVPDTPGTSNRLCLHGNYPNPFNPRTTISFELLERSRVVLCIYDAAGRLVRTLVNGEEIAAGHREMVWDGRDGVERSVAAGTYFCRLKVGGFHKTIMMTLVK
jgi:hypothetical protein